MSIFPDFSDDEINIVSDALAEHYGAPTQLHLADVELRLSRDDREPTERPALYWEAGDCHFVIVKLGPFHYHNQFFYRGNEQFSTSRDDYDDILDCAVTLLRLQADHQSQRDKEASA
jgi:hypothetical protein